MNQPFIQTFYVQHGNHHLESDTTNNVFDLIYLSSSTKETTTGSMAAFPNPFTDDISISGLNESTQLRLYDQQGGLVAYGYNRLDDMSKLPVGIYFLQIIAGRSITVKRMVKVE